MSEPRKFSAAEVRACIDAGKIVCLGPHMKLARIGPEIVGECSRCGVRLGQVTGPESLGTLPDEFGNFVIRHQHTEAPS